MISKAKMKTRSQNAALSAMGKIQSHVSCLVADENTRQHGNRRSDIQKRHESYSFIPMNPGVALRQLVYAYEYLSERRGSANFDFLDAGCGPGNIMLLAKCVGFSSVTGLEFDFATIQAAKHFNPLWRDIKRRNILSYRSYKKFGVIYYYCPIDGPLQKKFEERVEDKMSVGALLLPHLKKSNRILKDKRFLRITKGVEYSPIYEKIGN